jgi:hypothetical protein
MKRRLASGAMLLLIIAAGVYLLPRLAPSPATQISKASIGPATTVHSVQAEPASKPTPLERVAKVTGAPLYFCGIGSVALDADDPLAGYRYLQAATRKTAQHWLSSLLNSDDTRARAAGLLLDGKIGEEDLAVRPMQERSRDELVALAVGAGDPAVYAFALSACNAYSTPSGGSCQQLSVTEWARLDPDNAIPWMLLAGKAQARHDAVAASGYFDRAAESHKVDSYNYSLFAYAEPEMPRDATTLERWYLTVQAVGVDSAMRAPLAPTLRYCNSAPADVHVKEQCSAVAEVLISSATTLVDYGIGVGLGARMGWSTARVRDLTDQRDAWMQLVISDAESDARDLWSCAVVEKNTSHMTRRLQMGELAALREQMEGSGKTVSELAQNQREWLDKARPNAQPAESPPIP